MRPDRIVVGEIRGGEALELIQAMTSGHGGCMSTVHATYPKDSLSRLETMALMSNIELPLSALRSQISSAIDIIVQVGRVRDGSRRVTHITEVIGCNEHNQYQLQDLFVLEQGQDEAKQAFVPTGVLPLCLEAIRMHGHDLPPAVYAAAKRRPR
jgi:pilus assembly protein CpaF